MLKIPFHLRQKDFANFCEFAKIFCLFSMSRTALSQSWMRFRTALIYRNRAESHDYFIILFFFFKKFSGRCLLGYCWINFMNFVKFLCKLLASTALKKCLSAVPDSAEWSKIEKNFVNYEKSVFFVNKEVRWDLSYLYKKGARKSSKS